jgi:predicted ATPase
VVKGRKTTPFISTIDGKIRLHQDGNKGRTTDFTPEKMPRTLLSTVTSESPTAFLARQEMRNWTMLQFEPTALRKPNNIYEVKNAEITANGSNLPATLYRLHNENKETDVYQKVANKVQGLVNDVAEIDVEKDEKRDLLTLQVKFRNGLVLPAQSLSDGTLRFLGLAILQEDKKSSGLICLEEPENGINPKKVEEMVQLLEEMATDTDYEVDDDNPLRQVIINTHSPLVVSAVADESLYLGVEKETYSEALGRKVKHTSFSALRSTWKTNNELASETNPGEILYYLGGGIPLQSQPPHGVADAGVKYKTSHSGKRSVRDNISEQLKLDL